MFWLFFFSVSVILHKLLLNKWSKLMLPTRSRSVNNIRNTGPWQLRYRKEIMLNNHVDMGLRLVNMRANLAVAEYEIRQNYFVGLCYPYILLSYVFRVMFGETLFSHDYSMYFQLPYPICCYEAVVDIIAFKTYQQTPLVLICVYV